MRFAGFALVLLAGCTAFGSKDDTSPVSADGGTGTTPSDGGSSTPSDGGSSPSTYYELVKGDQPKAYWRMSLRAENPIIPDEMGGPALQAEGTTGSVPTPGAIVGDSDLALHLDAASWKCVAPPLFAFDGTSPFTIEFWVMNEGTLNTTYGLIGRADSGGAGGPTAINGYGLEINNDGKVAALFGSLDGNDQTLASKPLATGWHHVVYVYGPTEVLYIDGAVSNQTSAGTHLPLSPSSPFRIANVPDTKAGLQGAIDEVAIYDRALDRTRVALHYTTGVGK
jgi:hypothetical protein